MNSIQHLLDQLRDTDSIAEQLERSAENFGDEIYRVNSDALQKRRSDLERRLGNELRSSQADLVHYHVERREAGYRGGIPWRSRHSGYDAPSGSRRHSGNQDRSPAMTLTLDLPTDVSIAIRRFANEQEQSFEEAAIALLRDKLIGLGVLEEEE